MRQISYRCLLLTAVTVVLGPCGCAQHPRTPASVAGKAPQVAGRPRSGALVVAVVAPGGASVRPGDLLTDAQKAWPAPAGAIELGPAALARLSTEGWGWMRQGPDEAFEVTVRDGRISAIYHSIGLADSVQRMAEFDRQMAALPPPMERHDGSSSRICAWTEVETARVLLTSSGGLLGPEVVTIVATRADLDVLGYPIGHLDRSAAELERSGAHDVTPAGGTPTGGRKRGSGE